MVGAISALAVVIAVLVVQHVRHGWPFSLHHGVGAPSAPRAIAPGTSATGAERPAPRAHVELAPDRWPALGVRVIPVRRETISGTLRTVVTIVPDESRLSHVHTRVSGWIDRLIVRTTGERVRRGQALAAIFSQELLASQTEYLAALRAAPSRDAPLVRGARERLQVFGMTPAQISALERRGAPERLVTVSAPRAGTVLRRSVTEGTAVDPSTELFTIADLSRVWALTEVPEVDAPRVRVGSTATLSVPASGLPPFEANVSFVYPTLSERTRTLRARFEVANPDGELRPGMYGTAEFDTATRDAIVVPRDAIVDTGLQQHVFVLEGESMLVPRVVSLGVRLDERVEVTDGLREGDRIVAAGVFLIDSESRLRASGGAGTGHAHGSGTGGDQAVRETPPTPAPSAERARRSTGPPSRSVDHQGHGASVAVDEPARREPEAPSASGAHAGHGGGR
ncbi:MAG: efflux RND transporter periplasmic adaptor subunit [Sandaracinaceae bacterium]|nr:efflux RND transporter periplasmic adaptor subunit [Sandaracinaceae bacterium]